MEMHRMQIPMEEDDGSWRQRCYDRMERLKAREFQGIVKPTSHQPRLLMQEQFFGERNSEILQLQKAVRGGNVDRFVDVLVQLCSEKKLLLSAIFNEVTPTDDSLFHVAAYYGKAKIAELIGHYSPNLLTKTNIKGDTPLHVAARERKAGVIKVILSQYDAHTCKSKSLLENKAKGITRLCNEYGNTALHEAAGSKDVEGVTLVFEADDCVAHYRNKSDKSPLYLAVLSSKREIVNLLLEAPFPDDEPLPKHHGNSPLHAAIYIKNAALLKEIIYKRLDLMYLKDEDGGTALHYAATRGYVEGVRILLKESTLFALEWNTKGHFPIHLACKWNRVEVLNEFLKQEWDDCRVLYNKKGQSILHVATNNGNISVVTYLLRKKKLMRLILNEGDKNGNTPLHLAVRNSFPHVVYYLAYEKSIDLNATNNEGYTARDILLVTSKLPPTFRQHLIKLMLKATDAKISDKGKSDAHKQREPPEVEWLKHKVNTLMVVAALIVTVTFAAGFTVPGGVYSSDERDTQKRGMAVLSDKQLFKAFVGLDTLAMYSSIFGSFTLLWAQLGDFSFGSIAWKVATFMVGLAMLSMNAAFMSALGLIVSNAPGFANLIIIMGVISSSLILNIGVAGVFLPSWRTPGLRLLSRLCQKILIIPYLIVRPAKEKVKKEKLQSSASGQDRQASKHH